MQKPNKKKLYSLRQGNSLRGWSLLWDRWKRKVWSLLWDRRKRKMWSLFWDGGSNSKREKEKGLPSCNDKDSSRESTPEVGGVGVGCCCKGWAGKGCATWFQSEEGGLGVKAGRELIAGCDFPLARNYQFKNDGTNYQSKDKSEKMNI